MVFTTLRSTNPNYKDSFAQEAESPAKHADSFAQQAFKWKIWNVWHVKGSLNEQWSNAGGVRGQLCEILEANSEILRPPKSLQNAKSPNYGLGCYLIGRDEHHARPAAAIICVNEHVRDMSKRIIDEHGILRRLGWMFLRFKADICQPMEAAGLPSAALEDLQAPEESPRQTWILSLDSGFMASPIQTGTSMKIPRSPIGLQIVAHRHEWESGRVATLGGIVEVDGCRYGITVDHIFDDYLSCEDPANTSIELFDEDLQDLEWEFLPGDMRMADSSGSFATFQWQLDEFYLPATEIPETIINPTSNYSRGIKPASYINNTVLGVLNHDPGYQSSFHIKDLHYYCIKLDSPERKTTGHWRSNSFVYKPLNEAERLITPTKEATKMPEYGNEILLCTGSRGVITGTSLDSSTSLNLCGSNAMTETWKCSFSRIIQGDCGSWAINPATSELLGMLVGNCPALNEAYIVPVKYIFSHIQGPLATKRITLPQNALHGEIVAASANVEGLPFSAQGSELVKFAATSLLYDAVYSGNAEIVHHLVEWGADVNLGDLSLIQKFANFSVRNGGFQSDVRHIHNSESEDYSHYTPLWIAIERCDIQIVDYLVVNGAKLDNIQTKPSISAEELERLWPNPFIKEILRIKREQDKKIKEEREAKDISVKPRMRIRSKKEEGVRQEKWSKGYVVGQTSRHDPVNEPIKVGIVALSLDRTKVLILQSSHDGWTLPNGTREAHEATTEEAACRHAWEKAGLVCTVSSEIGLVEEAFAEQDSTLGQDQPESSGASEGPSKSTYRFFEVSADREEVDWPDSEKRMRNWVTFSKAEFLLYDRPAFIEAIRRSSIEREEQ